MSIRHPVIAHELFAWGQPMITNDTKYGLKAALFLAKNEASTIAQISDREALPTDALTSILARLERGGFIKRSAEERYSLARPADTIMVGHVVRTLDGPLAPIPCVSETAYRRCTDCRSEEGCEVRRVMRLVRDATAYILDNTSLLDMGAGRNARVVIDEVKMVLSMAPDRLAHPDPV